MSYKEVISEVLRKTGTRLSKSHISDWVNGKHDPYGSVNEFSSAPVPELAYVIGVVKGDATLGLQKWTYRLRLRVIGKEFAEEFDRCASFVIRSRRHSLHWLPNSGLWCVEVCSVLLYKYLNQSFSVLKKAISHCEDCIAAFLRGFFDSEASVSGRSLTVSNASLQVLRFVGISLRRLQVSTTGPYLSQVGGRPVVIKGKIYRANKNIYILRVRAGSLEVYSRRVGFAIKRKERALRLALNFRGRSMNVKRKLNRGGGGSPGDSLESTFGPT